MASLHQRRTHPEPVAGCFGCRVSSVQFALGASTERAQGEYDFQADFAAEFHNGDREAYRRLRANGLQPPSIRGSAHLERHAETRFEVETGTVVPPAERKDLTTALELCAGAGLDPLKVSAGPA